MTGIFPIPTGRISDSLTRSRLTQQTQADQLDLFRLQNQISTGRRIFKPSDDAPSALRAITLQRNIERKEQVQINLRGAEDSLTAAEGSLQEVATVLNDLRGDVLPVVGTIATDEQRAAVLDQIDADLQRLVDFGNATYQDNYLFAGTRAVEAPYVINNEGYVEYRGNESSLRSFVDVERLFETGIPGQDVFGGFSASVRGREDLDPHVTRDTFLSQLNGGQGVTPGGSIDLVFVPTANPTFPTTTTIDLSGTHTVGDVIRRIESAAPEASGITVSIEGNGLRISSSAGQVAVNEIGLGRTGSELGIVQTSPTASYTGSDLDPTLRRTTSLDSLLGSRASARLNSVAGSDNDIRVTANTNGASLNGVSIEYVDAVLAGSEVATYDSVGGTLQISIESGTTTAQQVIDAINLEGTFSAEVDYFDATVPLTAGTGVVLAETFGVTAGGTGETLDLSGGLQITNGGEPFTIDLSGAETFEDLLNKLNAPEHGLSATLNESGNGIDIRSRRSGADFAIGENGGQLAQQLGIRTTTGSSRIEDFNLGVGVIAEGKTTLELTYDDGGGTVSELSVDLTTRPYARFDALAASVTGRLTTDGGFTGEGGNAFRIVFAEDNAVSTHSASLTESTLTVTVGTNGAGATLDLDTILSEIPADQLTAAIDYQVGDLQGDYTVGTDVGAAITFAGGGSPVTVDGLQDRIDAATDGLVTASIASVGNGISLSFDNSGGQSLTASGVVAERLGLVSEAGGSQTSTTGELVGTDANPQQVESVFNTLLRLRSALQANETTEIARQVESLQEDQTRATFARSELGARLDSLDTLKIRLEDEEVELRNSLSLEIDVDLTEAISNFTARQFSLQASLQTTASLLQLTVLNFI